MTIYIYDSVYFLTGLKQIASLATQVVSHTDRTLVDRRWYVCGMASQVGWANLNLVYN